MRIENPNYQNVEVTAGKAAAASIGVYIAGVPPAVESISFDDIRANVAPASGLSDAAISHALIDLGIEILQ